MWRISDLSHRSCGYPSLVTFVLVALAGGGLFWWYDRSSDDLIQTVETEPAPAAASSGARPSVAVLPFENRSREADDASFVDGIHDDILTQLSKVSALSSDFADFCRAYRQAPLADGRLDVVVMRHHVQRPVMLEPAFERELRSG